VRVHTGGRPQDRAKALGILGRTSVEIRKVIRRKGQCFHTAGGLSNSEWPGSLLLLCLLGVVQKKVASPGAGSGNWKQTLTPHSDPQLTKDEHVCVLSRSPSGHIPSRFPLPDVTPSVQHSLLGEPSCPLLSSSLP
jgi:hypothetical protein